MDKTNSIDKTATNNSVNSYATSRKNLQDITNIQYSNNKIIKNSLMNSHIKKYHNNKTMNEHKYNMSNISLTSVKDMQNFNKISRKDEVELVSQVKKLKSLFFYIKLFIIKEDNKNK